MLTCRESQTKTVKQITAETRTMFLSKAPKLVKKTKGAARK
jgi:hypothetical protein